MSAAIITMPSRAELIALCVEGIKAQEADWCDRDSAGACRQLGECLALLSAGCEYMFPASPKADANTIWVEVTYKGFSYFDWGGDKDTDTFYIPTRKRLDGAAGKDWY